MVRKLSVEEIKEAPIGMHLYRRIKDTGERIECETIRGASTILLRDTETGRLWPVWNYKHMVLEV